MNLQDEENNVCGRPGPVRVASARIEEALGDRSSSSS